MPRPRTITSRSTAAARYLKQQPIAAWRHSLDPARFVRIHRSAIVNLERVGRIEPYGKESRIAILADGTRLPVSRPATRGCSKPWAIRRGTATPPGRRLRSLGCIEAACAP